MIKTRIDAGPNGTDKWNIDKPMFTVPKITREYFDDKVRMYKCGKKIFLADVYDRMFLVIRSKIKPEHKRTTSVEVGMLA